jgi:hypothetical protein
MSDVAPKADKRGCSRFVRQVPIATSPNKDLSSIFSYGPHVPLEKPSKASKVKSAEAQQVQSELLTGAGRELSRQASFAHASAKSRKTTGFSLFHGELGASDRCYWSNTENLMMSVHWKSASTIFRGVALALAVLFYVGDAAAQNKATVGSASAGPFAQLAGGWSGSGTIDLLNGRHEPIKCRASYDVLENQSKLQLNIRCASESYNFDLRASAAYAAGAITGAWTESTRNAAGTLSGKVEGVGFQVVAKGPTFTANLNLVTRGDKQSVTIRSQDAQADVQGATITLQRG